MDDLAEITRAAHAIAVAIERKDDRALLQLLSPDFVLRKPGAGPINAAQFAEVVRNIPAEVLSVRLEHLEIDLAGDAALATGIQCARVRDNGEVLDDRRPFVDWFVRDTGRWRLRAALDLG